MALASLGLSGYDIALPVACSAGAIFGSLVQAMLATISHDGPPNTENELRMASPNLMAVRGAWLFMRLFVGGVLGFVFGLYFVGTIIETPATFAKVWALSFIVGYAAPRIWTLKEDALVRRAERELDT